MALPGLMQRGNLNVSQIIDYAARWHPEQTVVCKTPEGPTVISSYADIHKRSQLCALALQALGVGPGDLVATMAWNTTRHMECWYGIMGLGAVTHTVNPRLSDKDIRYIVNDAADGLLLSDISFATQRPRSICSSWSPILNLARAVIRAALFSPELNRAGGSLSLPAIHRM
ncbi:hypothetical protein FOA52_008336 [Chlamydomonas sp. UWO 241]|nr:hypothetical protein FOA52_008336 [Chlamydomonas sp. UWO 241]